jgi:hypothetical protein
MTTVTSSGNNESNKPTGLTRTKSKKWAFLGRSKSKRLNSTSENETTVPSAATNQNTNAPKVKQTISTIPITEVQQQKQYRNKPAVSRSRTDPGTNPKSAFQDAVDMAGSTIVSTPRLDVEIPDIKLERYSVMFKGLFQNQQASTLIARRQATVSRLRAIEDEMRREQYYLELREKRATTTSPPTEMAPTASTQTPNVVPLRLRSNTYPVTRDSIPEEPFESLASLEEPSITSPSSTKDGDQRPKLLSKFHKPSSESRLSPYYRNLRPSREYQPSGRDSTEQITPTIQEVPTETTARPKKVDIPARSTSLNKAAPKTGPGKEKGKEKQNTELGDAVEVSIARQISISRQQRKLLKPFRERASSRTGSADTTPHIASSSISTGENKRLAATKTGTPTIIHPEDDPDSPQRIYRRSERVILEGA